MGTTMNGLPYPEPTEAVANGAANIKALAEAIDPVAPIKDAWIPYVPTVANYPLGASATVAGRYMRAGKTVMVYNMLAVNAAYGGTATITFSPPFPLKGGTFVDKAIMGSGTLDKTGAGQSFLVWPYPSDANVALMYQNLSGLAALVDNTGSLKLAAGDYLHFTYTAELA